MSETFRSAEVDPMPAVIEEITRTMELGRRTIRLDLHSRSEALIPATDTEPPSVNFTKLAHEVVREGLFAPHPNLSEEQLANPSMPQQLLEIPYISGPAHIEMGGDVPIPAMEAVRGGFIRANRIVMQPIPVGAYFHRRFASYHPLLSPGIINRHEGFNAESFYFKGSGGPPNTMSFQVEGANRATYNGNLFTADEQLAAVDLAARHPELLLAINAYQGTLMDYLCELGVALDKETRQGNLRLNQSELVLFANYINEWRTDNFYQELLPSVAIFLHNARIREPQASDRELITVKLLHNALDFAVQNGAFRNHVTVPGDVAADHKERVNKFVCPAVNMIREHLVDGRLLHETYHYLLEKSMDGDSLVMSMTADIRRKVISAHPEWYGHPPRAESQ